MKMEKKLAKLPTKKTKKVKFLAKNKAVKKVKSGTVNALDTQVGGGHYKNMKIQPVEFCQVNQLNTCEANIVKYICRYKNKNGVEDLRKVKHYLELLCEIEGYKL